MHGHQRTDTAWEAFFSMLAGEMITSMHGMRERLAIKGKKIETLMVIGQGVALCGVSLRSKHACVGEEFVNGVVRWRYDTPLTPRSGSYGLRLGLGLGLRLGLGLGLKGRVGLRPGLGFPWVRGLAGDLAAKTTR